MSSPIAPTLSPQLADLHARICRSVDYASRLKNISDEIATEAFQSAAELWAESGTAPLSAGEQEHFQDSPHQLHSDTNYPHKVWILGAGRPECLDGAPGVVVTCTGYEEAEPFQGEDDKRHPDLDDAYWVHISDFAYPLYAADELQKMLLELIELRFSKLRLATEADAAAIN